MKRKPGSAPGRAVRVTEQLHQELAEMIRAEVKDPRVGLVTVTSVDLTPDYAYATVWFSVLPDDEAAVASTLAGLRAAAGFLRSQIGMSGPIGGTVLLLAGFVFVLGSRAWRRWRSLGIA